MIARKRCLAGLLAAAMLTSMLPAASASENGDGSSLLLHYDMSLAQDGILLADTTGNGHNGTLLGGLTSTAEGDDTVLKMTGNKNQYVALPEGSIGDDDNFTMEATFQTDTQAWQWLYCLGAQVSSSGDNYLFVAPINKDTGTIRCGIKKGTEIIKDQGIIDKTRCNTITTAVSPDNITIYLNGTYVSTVTHSFDVTGADGIVSAGTKDGMIGYIGKSLWSGDPGFTGTITDFKIYDRTLTAEEVNNAYWADRTDEAQMLIAEDMSALSVPDTLYQDYSLTTSGDNGSKIDWSVSENDAVQIDKESVDSQIAVVTRPESDSVSAILTATLSLGQQSSSKQFPVTVPAKGNVTMEDPALLYTFDETLNGSTVSDSSGNGLDGTLYGNPVYQNDATYGQVLYLDGYKNAGGSDSYLEIPATAFKGRTGGFTVSMDVNEITRTPLSNCLAQYATFSLGSSADQFLTMAVAPESVSLSVKTSSGTEATASNTAIYPNNSRTWVQITFAVTDNTLALYRDGVLVASNTNTGITVSDLLGADGLAGYLGKSPSGAKYFRGMFDNVSLYDGVLNPDQVKKLYTDTKTAREARLSDLTQVANAFTVPDQGDVRGNIYLPEEISGVSISWQADPTDIVSTEEADGKPAGVVTRPAEDTDVMLTGTFSKDGDQMQKTYNLTVKAKPAELTENDWAGYLFVHFTGTEGSRTDEQTYFSLSKDGLNWSDLNKDKNGTPQPVLPSTIGESGLRDHFIARSPDGDKFYMIATDLSIYENKAWRDAGASGSHSIVVWESEDLINWSEPRLEEIAPKDAGCTWAPEFTYEDTTGEYVIYWSATTLGIDSDGNVTQEYENHSIYYCKTRDFVHFTDPQVYHAGGTDTSGKPIKVIDSTMIKEGDTYYRYTKNESTGKLMVDKASSVLGNFTTIDSQTLSTDLPNAQGAVEGPIIFKLNQKDENGKDQWCLMADRFAKSAGYYPMITTDLDSGNFRLLGNSEFSMPSKFRHGYVMPVTKAEYDRLQSKWGGLQRPEVEDQEPFYAENFESFSIDGALTLNGNAAVTDDADRSSKVLTLAGTTSAYAALPAGWLDGLQQATISFDVMTQLSSGNFFTFALGQDSTKYVFFRAKGTDLYTAITTGSYSTESKMTATLAQSAVGKWVNVTIVFDGTKMYLYVDGALSAKNESTGIPLTSLGADAKVWFGRSFYSGDSYFKGSFDNIKMFNSALTKEQIAGLSAVNAAAQLSIGNANTIMGDFLLPTVDGVDITWESSDSALQIEGNTARFGIITENRTVNLTATVQKDGLNATKVIPVTLIAPENQLAAAADELTLPYYLPADDALPQTALTASVEWDKAIDAPESAIGEEQTLTATLKLDGKSTTKAFTVRAFRSAGTLVPYVIANNQAVAGQADAMTFAVSTSDGVTMLNKGQPVLYSKYLNSSKTLPAMAYPSVFRKADGSFGVIAVAQTQAGAVLLYDSTDLTSFKNERAVTLQSAAIERAEVMLGSDKTYKVYWRSGGKTYVSESTDLTMFSAPKETTHEFSAAQTGLPAKVTEAGAVPLTAAELAKVTARFGTIYNTGIDPVDKVVVKAGDVLQMPERVTVRYSDGSAMLMGVEWNTGAVNLQKAGTYTVTGTVQQPSYTDPLILERADPYIVYNEDDGYYYFTASYPQVGSGGVGYDRIILRRAKTVEGLKDAEEVEIWNQSSTNSFNKWIWAPELHKIGDSWYVFTTASPSGNVWAMTPILIKCNNASDMMNPSSWDAPVRIKAMSGDNTFKAMSLDMTHFTANGKDYLIWADTSRGSSSLLIATIDPADPSQLTSNATLITGPEYSWERYGIAVNEGPAVIHHDGKVYLAFSAASTGSEYCVGMMTADEAADLLNVNSWTKSALPVMTTADFTNGLSGPGHNSFTIDEYGNPLIIYHARPAEHLTNADGTHGGDPLYDPCRHARVKTVHFAADGRLVLNMTPEEELDAVNKTVSVTVEVQGTAPEGAKHIVSFESNGGTTVGAVQVTDGGLVTRPTDPIRSGYTFAGWYKDSTLATAWGFADDKVTADMTLFAKWRKKSSGSSSSGSSSDSTTTITTNSDGSVTTAKSDATGTKTETTKFKDGSQTVVEIRKDGAVSTSVKLSRSAVAAVKDEPVKLPIPEVPAAGSRSGAQTVKVESTAADSIRVKIPVSNVTPGTVAVLVEADGTERIVRTSAVTEDGIVLTVDDGAIVKVVDNGKSFVDVPTTNWASGAVAFVSGHELFSGTSANAFSPDATMTRAMLFTVLARMDGQDTSGGATWYEKALSWAKQNGISDGANPDERITREQLITILYRYTDNPGASENLNGFSDAVAVSDYADDAMRWGVSEGLLTGKDGNRLDPQGSATRAEVATILMRYINK